MEVFNEVEWGKSNATTQELVCNCRSESVLYSVNYSYGVRFGSTSSQKICRPDASKDSFMGNFWRTFLKDLFRNFYRNFLNEHSTNAFREHTQSPSYGPNASS